MIAALLPNDRNKRHHTTKMAAFFRNHSNMILALGTGVALGITVTYLVQRVSHTFGRDLVRLTTQIEGLKRDLELLRSTIEEKGAPREVPGRAGFYSVHASSGEDESDDEFLEAYEGSDAETLGSQSVTSEEYVTARSSESLASLDSRGTFFRDVDRMLDGSDGDKERVYRMLEDRQDKMRSDAGFLWRMAKAAFSVSQIEGAKGNVDGKKDLVYKSKDYALRSLEHNDRDPNAHKWCAITLGSVGDYEGTQAKILNGFKFKEHIEQAIQIEPNDASSLHLMGRWCYGVYMLSWLERKAAATLFATPPTATVEEALENFLKADSLSTFKWKENTLFIAKCYIEKRDYYAAVEWLDKATNIDNVSQDDREAQTEIDGLLYKYSGYRR